MAGTERSQSTRHGAGDPSGHSLTLVVTPLIAVLRPPSTPSTPGAASPFHSFLPDAEGSTLTTTLTPRLCLSKTSGVDVSHTAERRTTCRSSVLWSLSCQGLGWTLVLGAESLAVPMHPAGHTAPCLRHLPAKHGFTRRGGQ